MTTLSLLLATTVLVSPGESLPAAIAKAHGGKVVLRPGTYLVERTIEIGKADDGLTLVAQKPGAVRLLGGRVLPPEPSPTIPGSRPPPRVAFAPSISRKSTSAAWPARASASPARPPAWNFSATPGP